MALCIVLSACDATAPTSNTGESPASRRTTPTQSPSKQLMVTLKPSGNRNGLERMDVRLVVEDPGLQAGQQFLRMPVKIVSTPTAAYTAEDIQVTDELGEVPLTTVEEEPTSVGVFRHWLVDRATRGDVRVAYGAPPRPVDIGTRNGPLFDLRRQGRGLMGAGVYFFALPVQKQPFAITLDWDLSQAPAGTRGIWSLGEGRREVTLPADTLAFSYYAVGPVQSYPGDPEKEQNFALYWMGRLPWEGPALGSDIEGIYRYMASFFEDRDASYKVFVRENPYPGEGGSGLASSFMFAYGIDQEPGGDPPTMLLAHEIAHNWPRFNGEEPHTETAWYTEGTAEFYSVLLAYRAGFIDFDQLLDNINEKARSYYTNPYVSVSNSRAGELFWRDDRAQRVPYGRGFMYLAQVDARIRAASQGRRRLDDVVLEILQRQRQGEPLGTEAWVRLLVEELGPEAGQAYEAMTAGALIIPSASTFGGCFDVVESSTKAFELGFDRMNLGVVTDLRPRSAAERAGLKEGDVILEMTPVKKLWANGDLPVRIRVKRGDNALNFSYLPVSDKSVTVWKWVKKEGASEDDCTL